MGDGMGVRHDLGARGTAAQAAQLRRLGMTIGMGTADEIKMHTKMGIANGLTRDEIQEIYYTAIPYCGLPKSNAAKAAMIEGFEELEAEGKL